MYDVVLALGSEKISNPNKSLSFQAYAAAMDVEDIENNMKRFAELSKEFDTVIPLDKKESGDERSIFMDVYAMSAKWHMKRFGSTQRQLAVIAAKNHWHASMNPLAQYQKSITVEEVLNDKLVSYPLTRPMCAPVGDGAAAAILCSESFIKKLGTARAVKIRASVLGSGVDRDIDAPDIGMRLAKQAYEKAGIGPEDIDTAELHDATAYGELHQTEAMGFCKLGEGGIFAESGATKLGGRLPINTSGGLESRGHPVGASGLAQIYEVILQLRGEAGKRQVEGARIALTENGGGFIGVEEAAMCINIFEKVK
jgi:acetyl-CoA acetyltransferase